MAAVSVASHLGATNCTHLHYIKLPSPNDSASAQSVFLLSSIAAHSNRRRRFTIYILILLFFSLSKSMLMHRLWHWSTWLKLSHWNNSGELTVMRYVRWLFITLSTSELDYLHSVGCIRCSYTFGQSRTHTAAGEADTGKMFWYANWITYYNFATHTNNLMPLNLRAREHVYWLCANILGLGIV